MRMGEAGDGQRGSKARKIVHFSFLALMAILFQDKNHQFMVDKMLFLGRTLIRLYLFFLNPPFPSTIWKERSVYPHSTEAKLKCRGLVNSIK